MLKELRLTNIILIESTSISFLEGFNVLSGESGSGKSAIMNALNLIAGERCDTSLVRRGADKGTVEAVFDVDAIPQLHNLLRESGIDHVLGNELFIRRELSAAGKSRAFINNQLAQLTLLRQVSEYLFDVIGQHANQKLLSLDYHRQSLDLYGDLNESVKAFASCWEKEVDTRQKLESLLHSEAQRMREIEVCRMELDELQEANLKEGEEEEVFAEYTQLSNADELAQKVGELTHLLSGEKVAILYQLNRQKNTLEQLVRLAPELTETAASYQNALLELDEVAHTLSQFENRIEHNPQRAVILNKRLELITRLKRKYGATVKEIFSYLKQTEDKLAILENSDIEIESLQGRLKDLSEECHSLSKKLTMLRKQTAKKMEGEIALHLHALNMPKAEFFIDITPQKRSRHGDDRIEFFLTPNVGEHQVSLRECASGGELSRIMLAMQTVLAGKGKMPTLVFDEIDANIGGSTATVVGEKLFEISRRHQVLCITHFHQVAQFAEHHLRISKQEMDGRTLTIVDTLDESSRREELSRMLGGISLASTI